MRKQYRFLGFVLDGDARELSRNGIPIELEPKAFEFLLLLAARPSHAFTKDELAEALWPGRIVGDSTIAQCVRKARQAVDDNANDQRVVKTMHGVGYRFAAELLEQHPDEPLPEAGRRKRPGLSGLLLGGALLVVLGFWMLHDQSDSIVRGSIVIAEVAASEQGPVPSGIADGVRALLSQTLSEHSDIRFISDSRSRTMLAGLGLDRSADDHALLAALHDTLGAEFLMRTRIEQADGGYSIRARLLDRNGQAEEINLPAVDIVGMVRGLSRDLARELDTTWDDSSGIPVLSDDAFINEAHARALNALLTGESRTAALLFESVLRMAPELLFARYELGNARWQLGDHESARRHYTDVLEQARERQSPRLAGHSATMLGVLDWQGGNFDAAQRHYRVALELYDGIGEHHGAASTLGNLGNLADSRGDLRGAADFHIRARARFRSAGDEVGESATYTNLAAINRQRSRMHEARRLQRQAAEMQRRLGIGSMLVRSLTYLAAIECELGDCDTASTLLDEAATLAEAQGNRHGLAEIALERARISLGALDARQAYLQAESARREFAALGMPAGELATMVVMAEAELLQGRPQAAVTLLEAADTLDQVISKPRDRAHRARIRARAAIYAGRLDAARQILAEQHTDSDPIIAALGKAEQAEIEWKEQRIDQALSLWRAAVDQLDRFDDPMPRARVQTRLARAYIDQDQTSEAEVLIANVLEWNRFDTAALVQQTRLDLARGDLNAVDGRLRLLQKQNPDGPADPDWERVITTIDTQRSASSRQ